MTPAQIIQQQSDIRSLLDAAHAKAESLKPHWPGAHAVQIKIFTARSYLPKPPTTAADLPPKDAHLPPIESKSKSE